MVVVLRLKQKRGCSPKNVVIRHFDRRFIRRGESTGQPVFSVDFKNTYRVCSHDVMSAILEE